MRVPCPNLSIADLVLFLFLVGFASIAITPGVIGAPTNETAHYPTVGEPTECSNQSPHERSPTYLPDSSAGTPPTHHVIATYSHIENTSRYHITFDIPANRTSGIQFEIPEQAALVATTGFKSNHGFWNWDKSSLTPTVVIDSNGTSSASSRVRGARFRFPHGEEWLLAPAVNLNGKNISVRPARAGAIGEQYLYLGPVSVHRNTVGCQEHIYIEPKAAPENSATPAAVLNVLNESARRLDVGAADSTVRIFASPTVPEGRHSGWASENEFVAPAQVHVDSVGRGEIWIHEYVHTRQDFQATRGLQWITEGSAEYLGRRLQMELGLISPREYDVLMSQYQQVPNTSSLNRAPPTSNRSYHWGAAVLSQVDRHLTVQNASVADLLAALNQQQRVGSRDAEQWIMNHQNTSANASATYDFHEATFSSSYPQPAYMHSTRYPPVLRAVIFHFGIEILRVLAGVLSLLSAIKFYQSRKMTEPQE
ncbi:MAG: hypothetical protein ACI8XM_000011 [Haloarculaceae archaeon]|jgi:hypothetical protein